MRNTTRLHPSFRHPKRSRRVLAALEEERRSWLASLGVVSPFQPLFDHLPGVCFFAKDRQGRTMFASRGVLDRYRMRHEHEILGLTDYDRNPRFMAEHYVRDDRRLLSGREKVIERLELWFEHRGDRVAKCERAPAHGTAIVLPDAPRAPPQGCSAHRQWLMVKLRTRPMSAPPDGSSVCAEDVADEGTRLAIFDCQLGIDMPVAEVARIRENRPSKPLRSLQRFPLAGGAFTADFGEISPLEIIY